MEKMKKIFGGLINNNKGVSYVISVLIVTVVVVIGALGLGAIQSTITGQVTDQTTGAGAGANAANELTISGSTTMQPLSECLGALYSDVNKGVRVTVQGGGSGAGIAAAGLGLVDMGSASKSIASTDLAKYPNLVSHKIGGSGVVVIASTGCNPTAVANATDLGTCYITTGTCNVSGMTNVATRYQRADASGTEETFAKYVGVKVTSAKGSDSQLSSTVTATGATGNQGVLDAVAACGSTTCCIGFVDYGYSVGVSGIKVLNVSDSGDAGNYAPTSANILSALKGTTPMAYPNSESSGLTRPLNYVVNGEPSVVVQSFLDFAANPGDKTTPGTTTANPFTAAGCFQQTGYFAVWEFS